MYDEVNFWAKTISRDKEILLIRMKGWIHQKDITVLNVYALNKANKNSELQEETDKSTNLVRDFNILLLKINRKSRQKLLRI